MTKRIQCLRKFMNYMENSILCTRSQLYIVANNVYKYNYLGKIFQVQATHSGYPFHLRKYSTPPLRTRLSRILSTENSCPMRSSSIRKFQLHDLIFGNQ